MSDDRKVNWYERGYSAGQRFAEEGGDERGMSAEIVKQIENNKLVREERTEFEVGFTDGYGA